MALHLSEKVVHFDPVGRDTSVFFDDVQCQIFIVRNNGASGVKVRSPFASRQYDLYFEDKGSVISIKFSPDFTVLGIQRSTRSVEFMNVLDNSTADQLEYSQVCKARSAKILGFCWVTRTEVVFITDSQGIESYQIKPEQKVLKSLRNYSLSVSWFLYTPPFLLLSSGLNCNVFHLFQLKAGGVYKRFQKFEVETTTKLQERDVALVALYGCLHVALIKQLSKISAGAEINLYQIREDAIKLTDILVLECNGRFAINILDNLIVVHHQQSRTSKIFDIRLQGRSESAVRYHYPIFSDSIEPYSVKTNGVIIPYELYSPNWAVFLPGVIVDAKLGYLWYLELSVEKLSEQIVDKLKRVEFFLLRDASCKPALLTFLNSCIDRPEDFLIVTKSFEMLTNRLKSDMKARSIFIDVRDIHHNLLLPLVESKHDQIYVAAILIEYVKALIFVGLEPPYYLTEAVVNFLVHHQMFSLLQEAMENRLFVDSKPLACLLLSLDGVFPSAVQLALDMLKRIGGSSEEIAEVLLARCEVLSALKILLSTGTLTEGQLTPRKFLESALQSGDIALFYSVFRFFQLRNTRLRGSPAFLDFELCDDIVAEYNTLFPDNCDEEGFV